VTVGTPGHDRPETVTGDRRATAAVARGRGRLASFFATPDWRILLLSIAVQLAMGLLLGHSRDTRLFMSAGYLVGTGHSPYVAHDLTQVFHHISFKAISTVGYPPPWPLLLGLIYRATYALGRGFLVYNLAIKLPVIAANIGLAYLVGAVLTSLAAGSQVARRAWMFLLLNPFIIYVGAAWGQIDAIVALLALAALWRCVSSPPRCRCYRSPSCISPGDRPGARCATLPCSSPGRSPSTWRRSWFWGGTRRRCDS
jgi:hypothetical protein